MEDILFVFAMKEEASEVFQKKRCLFTGLGKINATYHLTKAIYEKRPSLVINLGTAGSHFFSTGTLVECVQFLQKDMDLTGLGFPLGHTPFDKVKSDIKIEKRFTDLPSGNCGSGDCFEMQKPKVDCDVIDMEAFALAKICFLESLPFMCLKFISDGANDSAHADWKEQLPKASRTYGDYLRLRGFF